MDRLSPVIALLALFACGGEPQKAAPARSRVDAVAADPAKPAVNVESFCETGRTSSPPFALPVTDEPAPASAGGWTWVNVWATWCGPCIAEMPMIQKWVTKLNAEGVKVDLRLLSADEDKNALAGFKVKHADWPMSLHMTDPKALPAWGQSLGLDPSPVLPVHLFVNPQGNVRCSRMGALGENDYEAVKAVMAAG